MVSNAYFLKKVVSHTIGATPDKPGKLDKSIHDSGMGVLVDQRTSQPTSLLAHGVGHDPLGKRPESGQQIDNSPALETHFSFCNDPGALK